MKKIMILGGSILQLPAILKAKEMGLQVIVVDMDENAIGFKYTDISLKISTIDVCRVVEAAKQYKIDGIMTLASDMPMRTVAAVAKELNIIGISEETALIATNKAEMRQCLAQNNVPIPKFYRLKDRSDFDSIIQEFEKCIIKPVDNSGSRGVFLIKDTSNLELLDEAFKHSKEFSRSGEIIVEEYMVGPEVSVETISIEGKVHVIQITDKLTTGAPYFVEMGHSQPSQLSPIIQDNIKNVVTRAVRALGIKNGPSHTEVIVTNEGAKIVELGARLGGDCITAHLVPLSTGIDMVECCIKCAIGEKPDLERKWNKGSAIRYLDLHPGIINDIKGIQDAESIDGVRQISIVHNVGEEIREIKSSTDRIGFVVAQNDDVNIAIESCQEAINKIRVTIN